jgi:predicted AAA+ superfamily ATPase
MSTMEGQFQSVIRQKLADTLVEAVPAFTRRDVTMPGLAKKVLAVVGMRRSGKTTYLWQVLSERLAQGAAREALVYFSFEDERLAGMTAVDLGLLLEEYYRVHPEWRDRQRVVFFLDEIQVVSGSRPTALAQSSALRVATGSPGVSRCRWLS